MTGTKKTGRRDVDKFVDDDDSDDDWKPKTGGNEEDEDGDEEDEDDDGPESVRQPLTNYKLDLMEWCTYY